MTPWTDLIGPAVVAERNGVPVIGSLVAGKGVAADTEMSSRISPATGAVLFHGGDAGEGAVEAAVATARSAFDDGAWGRAGGRDRARVLARTALLLEQRAEQFAEMLVLET